MLTVILLFILAEGIIKLVDLPFKKRIENSTSVEDSLRTRKQLKVVRRLVSFVLILVMLAILLSISIATESYDSIGKDIGMVIAYAIVVGWRELRGNVQDRSLKDYLAKNTRFALYLRAFEADYYSTNPKSFSFELFLCELLSKKKVKVCAVGMTKEVDAPLGAVRVYLPDESWQDGVRELIERSGLVFVLVSDRDSCVWEIMQSASCLSKVCFFLDSIERYSNVVAQVGGVIPFPSVNEIKTVVPTIGEPKKNGDVSMCALLFDEKNAPLILQVDDKGKFLDKILSSQRFVGKI